MASHKINLTSRASEPDEVERLRRELAASEDRALRLRADFENYRRRVARERDSATHEGRRDAVRAVLPVLDALDRAIAGGSTDRALLEGIVATRTLLLGALRECGAEPIEALGKRFDPTIHEAVGTAPASPGAEPGTVVHEVRSGWRLGDVLRPTQVIVSTAASPASAGRDTPHG